MADSFFWRRRAAPWFELRGRFFDAALHELGILWTSDHHNNCPANVNHKETRDQHKETGDDPRSERILSVRGRIPKELIIQPRVAKDACLAEAPRDGGSYPGEYVEYNYINPNPGL